ncbi:FecR domain-containing protein [Allopusillimonas ginsengisoli]|uniref:FecR domain-containing protein n=1 Tax=Allopusillimonas ginsengisoli TaxID=453575 RepID=UPI0039C4B3AD
MTAKSIEIARSVAVAVAATIAAMLLPAPASAQPAGAQGENFIYLAQPGDTLGGVAQRFTETTGNWRTLQTLNNVSEPTQLQIGKAIHIPFSMIPEAPSQARVLHVQGTVTLDGRQLSIGDSVDEAGVIVSGDDSYATLQLEDGSTMSIPAGSSMNFERLRVFQGTRLTDSIIHINDGGLESQVAPEKTGVGRFEVRTPVTITGVRGTELRVRAGSQGSQTEVLEGRAELTTSGQQHQRKAALHAGQGAVTDASGTLKGVRALLPAPELPAPERGASGWGLQFAAVPGAASYLVRVAGDENGSILYSSHIFPQPDVTFRAPGAGNFYVLVRAIDADGLQGADAAQPFPGQPVLNWGDGQPVMSGFGMSIMLTDY